MKISKLPLSILRYCIFLPVEIILIAISALELFNIVLVWIGINYLNKFLGLYGLDTLSALVGFKDGITPFSSWHNFAMYILMTILTICLLLPILNNSIKLQESVLNDNNELNKIRSKTGKSIGQLADSAKILLLIIAGLILFEVLKSPLPPYVRWIVLTSIGVSIAIDNLTWSRRRHQYGVKNSYEGYQEKAFRAIKQVKGKGSIFEEKYKKIVEEDNTKSDSQTFKRHKD